MKDEYMKYFKTIGQINNLISKAYTIDEALHEGLKIMHDTFRLDASVLWYVGNDNRGLRPYFWYGAYDFSAIHRSSSDGCVWQCYDKSETIRLLNYKTGLDSKSEEEFAGKEIASMLLVPICMRDDTIGCIQLVKFKPSDIIDDDTADVCEIMANMIGVSILENESINNKYQFDKVLISTREIHKSYISGGDMAHVLRGVNLDIYEGEFLAILGESGCGKSTFLNIIGGMDSPDEGSFKFMGKEMAKADKEVLTNYRRNNIGFVFQSYNLMPNLTSKQNLDMIAELVKNPLNSDEVLDMVGLSDKKDLYPGQLSGGQQQRVSIARALVKRPKIIFADEPTAALDYETSIEVLSVFEKVLKTGTTLVMVTHNEEITRMADRVLRLRNGQTYEITINKNPVHANELVW